jgi:hypothetical protein
MVQIRGLERSGPMVGTSWNNRNESNVREGTSVDLCVRMTNSNKKSTTERGPEKHPVVDLGPHTISWHWVG